VSGFAKLPTAFTSQQKGRKRRRLAREPFFGKNGGMGWKSAGNGTFWEKWHFLGWGGTFWAGEALFGHFPGVRLGSWLGSWEAVWGRSGEAIPGHFPGVRLGSWLGSENGQILAPELAPRSGIPGRENFGKILVRALFGPKKWHFCGRPKKAFFCSHGRKMRGLGRIRAFFFSSTDPGPKKKKLRS